MKRRNINPDSSNPNKQTKLSQFFTTSLLGRKYDHDGCNEPLFSRRDDRSTHKQTKQTLSTFKFKSPHHSSKISTEPETHSDNQLQKPLISDDLKSRLKISNLKKNIVDSENQSSLLPSMELDPSKTENCLLPKSKTPSSLSTKLTPLEVQVKDLKRTSPDLLLAIQVGYKYRFFENDALVAAQLLNIVAHQDRSMVTASVPVHRVLIHVKKLVNAGHKVGIVDQIETAAIKAVSDSKNKPFERQLTKIYSMSTFIDSQDSESLELHKEKYLICILEQQHKASFHADRVQISLAALDVATCSMVIDEFEDTLLRTQLETRLENLAPVEFLLPKGKLTTHSSQTIMKYIHEQESKPMIHCFEARDFSTTQLQTIILSKFTDRSVSSKDQESLLLDSSDKLKTCFVHMYEFLKVFHLETVFNENCLHLRKFIDSRTITLHATTLKNLEIFKNNFNGTEEGTVWNVVNRTATKMGSRMLGEWLSHPIKDKSILNSRQNNLDELREAFLNGHPGIKQFVGYLRQTTDVEKLLSRIYYKRCSPLDVYKFLNSLKKLSEAAFNTINFSYNGHFFQKIADVRDIVTCFLVQLRSNSENNLQKFWVEDSSIVLEFKEEMKSLELDLQFHLTDLAKQAKIHYLTNYIENSGISHLLEVKIHDMQKVPETWIKISSTKTVARFQTQFIQEKLNKLKELHERIQDAEKSRFVEFQEDIANFFTLFQDSIYALSELDCLFSLVYLSQEPGYIKVQTSDSPIVNVRQGRNPIVEKIVNPFIANDVNIEDMNRSLLITGPNMGGKSCFVKQVVLIALLHQIGSYVPAEYAEIGIFDNIFVRMGASDDLAKGQSTFMKELSETSFILKNATKDSLVILDELGRGTSTHDGMAIAYATLLYMIQTIKCALLFVTHYPQLSEVVQQLQHPELLKMFHMGLLHIQEPDEHIIFTFKLMEGVLSGISHGLNVAKLAHLPESILKVAKDKSNEFIESSKSESLLNKFVEFMKYYDRD